MFLLHQSQALAQQILDFDFLTNPHQSFNMLIECLKERLKE